MVSLPVTNQACLAIYLIVASQQQYYSSRLLAPAWAWPASACVIVNSQRPEVCHHRTNVYPSMMVFDSMRSCFMAKKMAVIIQLKGIVY